jgi:hypothetical protein
MAFRAEDDEDEVAGPSHPNFIQHSRSGLGANLVLFRGADEDRPGMFKRATIRISRRPPAPSV